MFIAFLVTATCFLIVMAIKLGYLPAERFGFLTKPVTAVLFVSLMVGLLSNSIFYAEPGYIYHVRTVLGNEEVVSDPGYKFYPFGRYNAWKRAMTVQAATGFSDSVALIE